jgi:CRP-like cAMP-binding protein
MTDYALPSLSKFLVPEDQALLASLGQRQSYADGDVIQKRGDPNAAMAVVIQGAVKLMRVTSDGRQVMMMMASVGQHYADNTVINNALRTHHAIAVGETIIDHYPRDIYLQLLEHPGIVKALYLTTSARLTRAIELFDDIRCLPPEVRLAKVLFAMRQSAGGANRLECAQDELASLLGISAMTLSKSLKVLKMQGLIDTGYRTVTILDHGRFNDWLAEQSRD